MYKFLAVLAAMATISAPLYAAEAGIDFDRGTGLNISAYMEQNADKIVAPRPSAPMSSYFTVGCHTFKLAPSNSSLTTNQVRIQSQEFVNECHYIPDPIPSHQMPPPNHKPGVSPRPTNGANVPSHNVHHPGPVNNGHFAPRPGHKSVSEETETRGGENRQMVCNERPGRTFMHNVRLNVGQRNLFPWETEEITVCAEHEKTWVSESKTPYVYNVSERTQMGGGVNSTKTFFFNPVSRNPSAPDENGLNVTSFRYSAGKFYMNVADKWANYYDGEKVVIHVALYKDRFLVDKNLGEKDFEFHVGQNYALEFVEGEFDNDKSFEPETEETRGKTQYYVKWGFKRIGYVSTDKYIKKGSTSKVSAD